MVPPQNCNIEVGRAFPSDAPVIVRFSAYSSLRFLNLKKKQIGKAMSKTPAVIGHLYSSTDERVPASRLFMLSFRQASLQLDSITIICA